MNTELKNAVKATDKDAQYDLRARWVLGQKLGLAKELPEHDETYDLHRLLGALLSKELTVDEKLDIVGKEYNIPIEEDFRKDVSTMCNLSQGIKEEGIAIGREAGRAEGEASLILKMNKNGFTAEQIAAATDKEIEEVEEMLAGVSGKK